MPDFEPEWHDGPPIARGYPDAIRVSACLDCGLRTGQVWEDCPVSGFQHRIGPQVIYRPDGEVPGI